MWSHDKVIVNTDKVRIHSLSRQHRFQPQRFPFPCTSGSIRGSSAAIFRQIRCWLADSSIEYCRRENGFTNTLREVCGNAICRLVSLEINPTISFSLLVISMGRNFGIHVSHRNAFRKGSKNQNISLSFQKDANYMFFRRSSPTWDERCSQESEAMLHEF